MHSERLRVIDLFCGAGGFSLGFQAAGCQVQAAVDVDEAAGRTFEGNFSRLQPGAAPKVFHGEHVDLEDFDVERLIAAGRPHILIGGPPCQGFSRIGRAKLDDLSDEGYAGDPRNELFRRFLDIAQLWQPAALVMENVVGMLSCEGKNIAQEAASEMARRGYNTGYAVLNAIWYGVPQFRERLFFVGIREDLGVKPWMPAATHRTTLPSGYARPLTGIQLGFSYAPPYGELPVTRELAALPATTVFEALGDLPALRQHLGIPGDDNFAARPASSLSDFARTLKSWPGLGQPTTVLDHEIRNTPRDYEIFRRMRQGDRYPAALAIARLRFEKELGRLAEQGNAPDPETSAFRELERRYVPPYPADKFVDKWKKLVQDQPSWTVTAHLAKDTYSHVHYDDSQARCISVREAARLQSFPDGFTFDGNMGDRFRQIGNAVPPLMAWAIACTVLDALGRPSRRPPWPASRPRSLEQHPGLVT